MPDFQGRPTGRSCAQIGHETNPVRRKCSADRARVWQNRRGSFPDTLRIPMHRARRIASRRGAAHHAPNRGGARCGRSDGHTAGRWLTLDKLGVRSVRRNAAPQFFEPVEYDVDAGRNSRRLVVHREKSLAVRHHWERRRRPGRGQDSQEKHWRHRSRRRALASGSTF